MKRKALTMIFLLTVLALFFIAGSLEQECITMGQAIAASVINFTAMAVSGYKSGMLTVPTNENEKK